MTYCIELNICYLLVFDRYAEEYGVLFNPTKSKLLCYNLLTKHAPNRFSHLDFD